jgi:hypothetical protein
MHPEYMRCWVGMVPRNFAAVVVVQPAAAANTAAAVAAVAGRIAGRLEADKSAAAAVDAAVAVAPEKVARAMAQIRNCGLPAAAGKIVLVKLVADSCCSTLHVGLGHYLRWVSVKVVPKDSADTAVAGMGMVLPASVWMSGDTSAD